MAAPEGPIAERALRGLGAVSRTAPRGSPGVARDAVRPDAAPTVRVRRRWRALAMTWLALPALVLAAYGMAIGALYLGQERLLFQPTRLPPDYRFAIEGVQERQVEVDGAVLSALHFRQPGARGVVFFLHGNGGNLAEWLTSTAFYRRAGYDLFMIDYRGYGKSTGRISSEAQLHADVLAAWNTIAPEYAGRRKVIYGRSLGTGLATLLATQVAADQLILVSPYRSIAALAAENYRWVPAAVLRYPMPTERWLTQVRMPVLLVHGTSDPVIPIAHAKALAALRPDAQTLWIAGAGHADIHDAAAYQDALAARLAVVAEGRPPPR
jgi:hypothetical protein